jgi:hypothetical protein
MQKKERKKERKPSGRRTTGIALTAEGIGRKNKENGFCAFSLSSGSVRSATREQVTSRMVCVPYVIGAVFHSVILKCNSRLYTTFNVFVILTNLKVNERIIYILS